MKMTCIVCGKEYQVSHSNMRRTCSKECEYAARSRSRKGRQLKSLQLDVTGQRYGELTAISRQPDGQWLFRCSCGKEIVRPLKDVRNTKRVVSCGHVGASQAKERLARWQAANAQDGSNAQTLRKYASGQTKRTNPTGVNGVRVRHNVAADVYVARIMVAGKEIYLGSFATLEEAALARKEAERKYWQPIIDAHESDRHDT